MQLYCVRPNSGRVEPGETVEVQGACVTSSSLLMLHVSISPVMLQAMKDEPPLNAKCKDKFLIQSTAITPEKETMSLQDIVRSVHVWIASISDRSSLQWTDATDEVHSQKIRVVYLPPEGQTVPEEEEGAAQSSLLHLTPEVSRGLVSHSLVTNLATATI